MDWLLLSGWLLKCLFSCNHFRTRVSEGKCFCPDCGQGLIYRWIVLRCAECNVRRESGYFLRQVVPAERCCAHCGGAEFNRETLESPSYYQLHKARLVVAEEQDYERYCRFAWTACHVAHSAGEALEKTMSDTWTGTCRLIATAGRSTKQPALLPIRISS
jgi:hypothetical protein